MRKHVMTGMALLPLLLSYSHAAQNWSTDHNPPPVVFWSEDGGPNSYLGVDIADVTSDRLSALKLKEERGVEVTMVDQDAPAGKAGIKEHDVILTMNGAQVDSAAQLRRMIHETPPGRVVQFGLSRDGQPLTVKVQLADRQKEFSFVGPNAKDFHVDVPEIHIPPIEIPSIQMVMVTSSARSGLTVENITPQLGDFFGVKNGNGVLVRAVEKGSHAEKAGFRAGDVIVKINDQPVHDTSDFTHAVRSRNGNNVSVSVMRDKREQNLNLSMPEKKDSGDSFLNESFDDNSLFNAENALKLSELQNQLAQMHPQMDLAAATRQAEAEARKAAEEARNAAEQARKAFLEEQRKCVQQSEKYREEFRQKQEQMRKEIERMTRELRKNWLDL